MQMDDLKARLTGTGIQLQGGTPGQFAAVIDTEIAKWGKVVKDAGIQPE